MPDIDLETGKRLIDEVNKRATEMRDGTYIPRVVRIEEPPGHFTIHVINIAPPRFSLWARVKSLWARVKSSFQRNN